ncbi:MAG: hypothetical protein V4689_22585 [Verrucomicrobiota bacterium]
MNSNDTENPPESDEPNYAPESHTVGAEVGAVSGGIAGAALGTALGGPVGGVAGAALGAAVGAMAGVGIAEGIDPKVEQEYWQKQYRNEPYFESEYTFEDYGPAYQLGWQHYSPHATFETAEERLSALWAQGRSKSQLDWGKAREAAKASWQKVHHTLPHGADATGGPVAEANPDEVVSRGRFQE